MQAARQSEAAVTCKEQLLTSRETAPVVFEGWVTAVGEVQDNGLTGEGTEVADDKGPGMGSNCMAKGSE